MNSNSNEYINSIDYKVLEDKIKQLDEVLDDLSNKSSASRKLRYAEVDVEAERATGKLQPDELYVPQHIIDTNIRREQPGYIQFDTQSPRAVICSDNDDLITDLSLLEKDLTKKLRYKGWQLARFANIDGLQANGYGVMEVVQDQQNPGEVACESVQFGDFAFILDARDIQQAEMVVRVYYFTKTQLVNLCGDPTKPKEEDFSREGVDKILNTEPNAVSRSNIWAEEVYDRDRSVYPIKKVMFRVGGIVHVAWAMPTICDEWLRAPRPLYIGRRKLTTPTMADKLGALLAPIVKPGTDVLPPSQQDFEKNYPYIIFPYLISENDTISCLKGRVFLDQDIQEAVTSLMSSVVTQSRRSAGLYGSKDTTDPNNELLMEENIFFKPGMIINSKVSFTQLAAPDPGIFNAIQMLSSANANETSQVNFAVQNRKDSRKTAKEIEVASQQATLLSTVQVVLYSIASCEMYTLMCDIIRSRVRAGFIKVSQQVRPLYDLNYTVKPSGDVDVIEKQQMTQMMMNAWPVMQNTPAAMPYLTDLIELMFPVNSAKYLQAFAQAQQQQQSAQAQQMQQVAAIAQQLGQEIVYLGKNPDMFSEKGRIHAYPKVEVAAQQIEQLMKQQTQGKK